MTESEFLVVVVSIAREITGTRTIKQEADEMLEDLIDDFMSEGLFRSASFAAVFFFPHKRHFQVIWVEGEEINVKTEAQLVGTLACRRKSEDEIRDGLRKIMTTALDNESSLVH